LLSKYIIKEDTIVLDKGKYLGDNRFEELDIVTKDQYNKFFVLFYKKGEEIIEPTRTEIGQWLLNRGKLIKKENDSC